jgi:aldose sugar dehydrogenase
MHSGLGRLSPRRSFRPSVERLEDRTVLATPTVVDPALGVRPVVAPMTLTTPIAMAFLGNDDFLILEKNTGQVKRVVNGAVRGTVLDLGVNFASERGLLGIALHPKFTRNGFVYLYWTESTTGADSGNLADVPLLGNRVDRFRWDGSKLTFDRNIIQLRAFQDDATNGVMRGNHNAGVIRFGPDGKLYVIIGDNGRRGQTQNLRDGPFGPGTPDDQFGGPQPDDAHLTGVILRLNDDGTAPRDNPFFRFGRQVGVVFPEVGQNIQKIYAYGIRNSFGMAFDPLTGRLWEQENGDDSFDELNLVEPGMNGGWVQLMGPVERIAQFKEIEVGRPGGLQQVRWPPTNIADTPREALRRLFMLPGAEYSDPEFSWKFAVAPAGIGFLNGRGLGSQYRGDLFVGAARDDPTALEGYLFHFDLTANRRNVATDDPRLRDRVADNAAKFDATESESLLFGKDFGVGTDIQTGPNGNLYVVSLTHGTVYEIFRREDADIRRFVASLSGAEEVPARDTPAEGEAEFRLNKDGTELTFRLRVEDIENVVAAHIHLGASGVNGPIVAQLFGPVAPGGGSAKRNLARGTLTAEDLVGPLAGMPLSALVEALRSGNAYVNVHTDDGVAPPDTGPGDFPGGEIRGQIVGRSSPMSRENVDMVFALAAGHEAEKAREFEDSLAGDF